MKKIGLVLGVLAMVLVLAFASVSWAGCPAECEGPFRTCMRMCDQTTKENTPERAAAANNCLRGLYGCIERCERNKDKKSEAPGEFKPCGLGMDLGASCIEEGLQCTLHGTPCCAPYNCKGKFPNTYCQ